MSLANMTTEEKKAFLADYNKTHLIRYIEYADLNSLEDLLLVIAKNVEAALLECGAEPGKDYTYMDLFKLAQPFVLEQWTASENITYKTSNF